MFFNRLMAMPWPRLLAGSARGGAAPGHIAIDGKTLKGTRRLDAKALHVLSAFATGLSAVIGDIVVEPGQNEITAALAFLKDLPLEGAVITGDAMFCQREICQTIEDGKGDYLFVVKDNQPELKAGIAESFGALSPVGPAVLPPDLKTAKSVEKEHGCIEVRKIAVSAEVIPHLGWPGAAQVARIERTREMSGKVSTETAYIVTSLTAAEAGPERLLELSRNHWAIENRLHYVRDVTFGEDRAQVIAIVTGRIF